MRAACETARAGVAAAALLALAAGGAAADVVHLVDGEPIEGRVVREDPRGFVVETAIGRVVLSRSQVAFIDRKPWTPPSPRNAAAPPPAPSAPGVTAAPAGAAPEATPAAASGTAAAPPEETREGLEKAKAAVGDLAQAPDPNHTEAAMKALAALGPDGFRALEEVLADRSLPEKTRGEVVQALGRVGDPRALPLLAAILRDEREPESVRYCASVGISFFRKKAGPAREALEEALARDASATVRQGAAIALGYLGDAASLPSLLEALGDASSTVRADAGKAFLACAPRPLPAERKEELLASARARPLAREQAAVIVAAAAAPEDLPVLISFAQDEVPEARRAAMTALGAFSDEQSRDALVRGLSDGAPPVRAAAASSLGRRKEKGSIERLIELLRDPETVVQTAARQALVSVTGESLPIAYRPWRAWWLAQGKERFAD
jgi:HEAT repeat protein